jgi:hypothetical protein
METNQPWMAFVSSSRTTGSYSSKHVVLIICDFVLADQNSTESQYTSMSVLDSVMVRADGESGPRRSQ